MESHKPRSLTLAVGEESDEEYDAEVDFGDFLVADLAQTIKDIHGFCHSDSKLTAVFGNTSITIDSQDVAADAEERLKGIVVVGRRVLEEESHLHPLNVFGTLLELDGWSMTSVTLRTPLWMRDVQEWPLIIVSDWHPELRCLEISISS